MISIGPAGCMASPLNAEPMAAPLDDAPKKNERKLGSAQICVLQMMRPEWVSSGKTPDSRSLSVLSSLERRGLVYQNFGRWSLTPAGRVAQEAHEFD